jgi:kynurenine formamidase
MRFAILLLSAAFVFAQDTPRGWTKGKGWGWVYGPNDEVGALNGVLTPQRVAAALRSVKTGRIYDLGVPVDQHSYKWPGHSPTQIMSFRSPRGVKTLKDVPPFASHKHGLAWHSCALFISDNLGTQIDGLGHITKGGDDHWYNGFKEADHGHDFGITKADADSIPPIAARAVLIDVAGARGVDALPSNFAIGPAELRDALSRQGVKIEPGDMVFIRTGTLRHWGANGSNHARIAEHDSAGITLEAARWLVEDQGASLIGSDTSGLEVGNDPKHPGVANLVHEYLLVDQGVHIGEFHFLEDLARNRVWRFVYLAMTNRLKGTVAGTAMRPVAIE